MVGRPTRGVGAALTVVWGGDNSRRRRVGAESGVLVLTEWAGSCVGRCWSSW